MAVSSAKGVANAKVDMETVRFYAQDKKKQPLTVVAPKVLETDPKKQLITLYKPQATYRMASGVLLSGSSSDGVVDRPNETITFENEVVATTDTGYRAVGSKIFCQNRKGTLSSSAPVTVTGPAGHLKAEGFQVSDQGNRIHFTGVTDTTIIQKESPIRIQSDNGLLIEQIPQTIRADQNVRVTRDEYLILADQMVLSYWTKEQNPKSQIKKIEAFGHVKALSQGREIIGDTGVYDPALEEIVMTGNVTLTQGNSRISGQTARFNLKTGESTLTPVAGQGAKGRVRGRLIPADFKGESK